MDFLKKKDSAPTRRKFLSGAAAATAGTLAFPMIAKGQASPTTMRWQSTWPPRTSSTSTRSTSPRRSTT